ncbi:hypothetical protein BTUL_0071g00390 [Botrytis tulipae]|uniref:Uncharacterized protein n=1 Tax=Botrytis tulipae TaxID=87230 RepID=A0A4Z1ERG6_9HELO|nr:hypothetical protein BTUL_0071g00390 [Botrytis tulipae]
MTSVRFFTDHLSPFNTEEDWSAHVALLKRYIDEGVERFDLQSKVYNYEDSRTRSLEALKKDTIGPDEIFTFKQKLTTLPRVAFNSVTFQERVDATQFKTEAKLRKDILRIVWVWCNGLSGDDISSAMREAGIHDNVASWVKEGKKIVWEIQNSFFSKVRAVVIDLVIKDDFTVLGVNNRNDYDRRMKTWRAWAQKATNTMFVYSDFHYLIDFRTIFTSNQYNNYAKCLVAKVALAMDLVYCSLVDNNHWSENTEILANERSLVSVVYGVYQDRAEETIKFGAAKISELPVTIAAKKDRISGSRKAVNVGEMEIDFEEDWEPELE